MVSREVRCPLCSTTYTFYTPKASSYSLVRRDSDHCPYYKDANPIFYAIWVCPTCHFAAYKDDFRQLEMESMTALKEALDSDTLGRAVSFQNPERSLFAVLRSFQLAALCYRIRKFPPELVAGLALRAGWICRYSGELRRELGFLREAQELYQKAFDKGFRRDSQVDDLAVAFLIGELKLRIGDIAGAQKYFMFLAQESDTKDRLDRAAKDRLYESKVAARICQLLEPVPLLAPIGEHLGLLAVYCEMFTLGPGKFLFRQGDPGESMFVIASGKVGVYREHEGKAALVRVLGPGEAFGEMSLLTGEQRSATVIGGDGESSATTEPSVELIQIHRTAFRNILMAAPEVAQGMANLVSRWRSADAERATHSEPCTACPPGVAEEALPATDGDVRVELESKILAKINNFLGLPK